jgi:muramoyltetrapeptide carboxypeptidase
MSFQKPTALRPKDTVCVVAPAGPFDKESFEAGLAVLSARYTVRFDEGIFGKKRYLAGDDDRRRRELQDALADDEVRAVFAARGGYGSMRLLPELPLANLPQKPLVGFSDITALHLALQAVGRVSFHAPVLTQLGRLGADTHQLLFSLLEEPAPVPALSGKSVVKGLAEGPLIGGNLSVLTRLLGTPYMPSLRGAVLLLEDVTERPYRLDRMWTHLRLAGAFRELAGIALGDFTECEEKGADYTSATVLAELAAATGLPCVSDLPIGHGLRNVPVPLGVRVRLDAERGSLKFLEPAVFLGGLT